MAKNISLLGADYPDVPAVVLPKTGGGSAIFVDPDELFITDSFTTDSQTVAVDARGVFSKSVSKSGYTPLGIIDLTLSNNYLCLGSFTISNNTAAIVFHNEYSSAITASVTFKVLYKKNL